MLRKVRITLAILFFLGITLLFVGIGQHWWGWMAKIQFLPACLALNLAVVIGILLITLIFGRIYCSVICPLGVYQDIVIWIRRQLGVARRNHFNHRVEKAKKAGKPIPAAPKDIIKRFSFRKERRLLRYGILGGFCICLVLGVQVIVALVAPYSAYGRMVTALVNPSGWAVPFVALVSWLFITWLALTSGREWCSSFCPVGTVLGLVSRFSIFRISIDKDKCSACGRCYRGCKASCIDGEHHKVDGSRCIDCFDCIGRCKEGAVHYTSAFGQFKNAPSTSESVDQGKRAFMVGALLAGSSLALDAQTNKLDGGLAAVTGKKAPKRETRLTPPGSVGSDHFYDHCTACQLCVTACPNDVLHPSIDPRHLMQPKMDFSKGFCRPECTECSKICPAGAILPLTPEEKTAVHIGRAVVDLDLCVVKTDGVSCGNCASKCPAGAIQMVRVDSSDPQSLRIPSVLEERCIGCGKCEYLCPSRPFSAIHIEGLVKHISD